MPKVLFLFLILFVIFQVSFAQDQPGANPLEWDFGLVSSGVIAKHNFVLKNETASILKITSVHSSCGCTVSQSQKMVLAPQESTNIEVAFNSRGYNGDVQQFIYVNTDNPDLSPVKFVIKARVETIRPAAVRK